MPSDITSSLGIEAEFGDPIKGLNAPRADIESAGLVSRTLSRGAEKIGDAIGQLSEVVSRKQELMRQADAEVESNIRGNDSGTLLRSKVDALQKDQLFGNDALLKGSRFESDNGDKPIPPGDWAEATQHMARTIQTDGVKQAGLTHGVYGKQRFLQHYDPLARNSVNTVYGHQERRIGQDAAVNFTSTQSVDDDNFRSGALDIGTYNRNFETRLNVLRQFASPEAIASHIKNHIITAETGRLTAYAHSNPKGFIELVNAKNVQLEGMAERYPQIFGSLVDNAYGLVGKQQTAINQERTNAAYNAGLQATDLSKQMDDDYYAGRSPDPEKLKAYRAVATDNDYTKRLESNRRLQDAGGFGDAEKLEEMRSKAASNPDSVSFDDIRDSDMSFPQKQEMRTFLISQQSPENRRISSDPVYQDMEQSFVARSGLNSLSQKLDRNQMAYVQKQQLAFTLEVQAAERKRRKDGTPYDLEAINEKHSRVAADYVARRKLDKTEPDSPEELAEQYEPNDPRYKKGMAEWGIHQSGVANQERDKANKERQKGPPEEVIPPTPTFWQSGGGAGKLLERTREWISPSVDVPVSSQQELSPSDTTPSRPTLGTPGTLREQATEGTKGILDVVPGGGFISELLFGPKLEIGDTPVTSKGKTPPTATSPLSESEQQRLQYLKDRSLKNKKRGGGVLNDRNLDDGETTESPTTIQPTPEQSEDAARLEKTRKRAERLKNLTPREKRNRGIRD